MVARHAAVCALVAIVTAGCGPNFTGPVPPVVRDAPCTTVFVPNRTFLVDFADAKVHAAVRGHLAAASSDGRWLVYMPLPKKKWLHKEPPWQPTRTPALVLLDRETKEIRHLRVEDGEYFTDHTVWLPGAKAFALGVGHPSDRDLGMPGPYAMICPVATAELRPLPQYDVRPMSAGPDGDTVLLLENVSRRRADGFTLAEVGIDGRERRTYAIGRLPMPKRNAFAKIFLQGGRAILASGCVLRADRRRIAFCGVQGGTWVHDFEAGTSIEIDACLPLHWIDADRLLTRGPGPIVSLVDVRAGTKSTLVK